MEFESCFFDTSDFEPTNKILGEGNFGKVFVVESINEDTQYAAKIIKTNGVFSSRDQIMFLRESLILHKLNHPAIIKFKGINFHSFEEPPQLEPTILTEYIPNGSLKQILDKEKNCIADPNWSPTKKYICLLGIADAMRYLHKAGILHRDLKPQNVLVDSDYYPRVCDFGLSRIFANSLTNSMQLSMTGKLGTPIYMAPELLLDEDHYGPAVDVYAFSILAYEIVTGKEPFESNGKRPTLKNLFKNIISGGRPEFTRGVPDNMKDLITQCWSQNACDRPSFDEIFPKLSTDFSYSEESVDEDEINEYLEILDESKNESLANELKDPAKIQKDQIEKMKEENKSIQTELVKYQSENKDLKEKLGQNERDKNRLQTELLIYQNENKDIKEKLNQNERDKNSLQTELLKYQNENRDLKEKLRKPDGNKSIIQTKPVKSEEQLNIEFNSWLSSIKAMIAYYPFSSVPQFTKIAIPSSVKEICPKAFIGSVFLSEITIPTFVTKIGSAAFQECRSLKMMLIPSSVTKIENNLFYMCVSLEKIVIPNTISSIGDYAFFGCQSLSGILLPASLTKVGNYAFMQCRKLKYVSIPPNVISIGSCAFYESINNKPIKSDKTKIGFKAFKNTGESIKIKICGIPPEW